MSPAAVLSPCSFASAAASVRSSPAAPPPRRCLFVSLFVSQPQVLLSWRWLEVVYCFIDGRGDAQDEQVALWLPQDDPSESPRPLCFSCCFLCKKIQRQHEMKLKKQQRLLFPGVRPRRQRGNKALRERHAQRRHIATRHIEHASRETPSAVSLLCRETCDAPRLCPRPSPVHSTQ